jgi:hypothetical protein
MELWLNKLIVKAFIEDKIWETSKTARNRGSAGAPSGDPPQAQEREL